MAEGEVIFTTDFSEGVCSQLKWDNKPEKAECTKGVDGGPAGLCVVLDAEHDYWQRTFYEPLLQKDNGHALCVTSSTPYVVMETSFHLTPSNQFDQGGLIVRLDSKHWIKTGLEYVDGQALLSCVTTNEYSDWSTQVWPSHKLHIRVFRQHNDFLVEASSDGEKWHMIRICHLQIAKDAELKMGLFACAPVAAGGSVVFEKLSLKTCKPHPHTTP